MISRNMDTFGHLHNIQQKTLGAEFWVTILTMYSILMTLKPVGFQLDV